MWSRTKTLLTRSPSLCPRPTSSKTWVILPLLSVCELPLHRPPFALIRLTISANLVSRSHNSTRHLSTTLSPLYGCPDDSDYVSSTPLDTSHFSYLSLVGGLLWDTLTRPDITVAVSRAYQHSSAPTADHWRASILVLHFLITTVEHLIVYLRKV